MRRGLVFSFLGAATFHAVLLFGFKTTGPVGPPLGDEPGPMEVTLVGAGEQGEAAGAAASEPLAETQPEPSPAAEASPEISPPGEPPLAAPEPAEPLPATEPLVPLDAAAASPSPTPAAAPALEEAFAPVPPSRPQPPLPITRRKTAQGAPNPAVRKPGAAAAAAGNDTKKGKTGTSSGAAGALPRLRGHPRPEYPPQARREHQEGVALVKVQVGPDGRPTEVTLAHSSGFPLLDEAAVRGVRRWTFDPATAAGVPVRSQVEVPVRFNLLP